MSTASVPRSSTPGPTSPRLFTASWIYALGIATLGALTVVLGSGAVLAIEGPSWWHRSATGRFCNGLHLWSTELFVLFMVVHLWAKFFMAAWRGRGRPAWVTGAVAFLVAIPTAFTGYLTQQNFDAEWIGVEAKDGLNATGLGAFFNPLDFGQMLIWHILVLALALVALTWLHLRLVRRHGIAPPIDEGPR